MSVRMKLTHSKTGSRRAHHSRALVRVEGTGSSARLRHTVDLSTGMYRGKQILPGTATSVTDTKKAKKTKATKQKKVEKAESKDKATE